uniref:Dehydrogenase/reductase SDR family member 11 n=1 Tax=Phallusia mammillata TaxID=59560 RepID=A0A6F9DAC6_9ASCI|nr:N-(5-amino-5-carboxypentanoyl)-L-cysteinyl-D-valine synthase-like [Phallusia mammillata]
MNKMNGELSADDEMKRYEDNGCLHEMFERQVQKTPNSTAVVDDLGRELTYAQLNKAADTLADHLILCGVVRDSSVGIYMERCMEYVIAYIAILKAGGTYIPLDVSYPDGLLEDIFTDAKPVCVVTNDTMLPKLKDKNQPLVVLNDGWEERLEETNKKAKNEGKDVTRRKVELDDLAYIVYSSGTTGKPKGIMCPHRGAVFSYAWRHLVTPFQEGDRVGCNVFFVWELLRPLLKGYPLYVIPDTSIYDPLLLAKFIKRNSITRMLFTPSLLETVIDAPGINMEDFSSMRLIWFCGEVVTTSLLDRCFAKLPSVKFFNLYSISECHDVSFCDLNKFNLDNQETNGGTKRRKFAPVGKVYSGVHVVILDEDGRVQPVGMPGEIFVGGPTMARGYLNRPEMNKARFINKPEDVDPKVGNKLYRTGDWGLIRSDRNLEICGRCDSMVKIRGYSIEIQAVESALMELSLVNACVVLAVGEEGQDKQLVAYLVPEDGATKKMVRDSLKSKLPFYMIPSYFVFLASIPVLPASGKLDKKALPSIQSRRASQTQLFTPSSALGGADDRSNPISETEEFLEATWRDILQLEFIDVQENFFDLGGHSLLAARLLGKLRERYRSDVTMQVLFANPTIVELAKWIDAGENGNEQKSAATLDLNSEVVTHGVGHVNLDIQLRAFWRSLRFGKSWRARVLLTGSTGFLGAFILRELLMTTKAEVYCLARRLPDKTPKERILQNLEFYQIFKTVVNGDLDLMQLFEKRVHAMTGDVALAELGMSEEDYTFLSYEIDYVIHAAAYVNLVYPYDALKGTNVKGTQNVLLFARTGRIKHVHYISTNAVYPSNKTNCKESPVPHDTALALPNGYSQSKWVAEGILLKGLEQGLPVTIYRIGNISGDSARAAWNPSDFILLVMRASIMTSSFPDVTWDVEMTPVDFVSKCIVKLSQDFRSSVHKIFHVVQPERVTGKWLFEFLRNQCGYELELVAMDEWCRRLENLETTSKVPGHPDVKQMLESITTTRDESLFEYNTTFDQSNLNSVLSTTVGVDAYPSMKTLFRTYISQLVKNEVLPKPPTRKSDLNNMSLKDRVAVVTGATSGIGKAIALRLAEAGAKVCISGRNEARLNEAKSQLDKVHSDNAMFQCDVTKRDQVLNLIKFAETSLGPVDIMVNNAGVMYYTHMSNVMMDDWDEMVDINCKGVTNGVGAVLPGMLKREKGHIVNISSDAGLRGFPGLAVYSGTKFFVEGFSQALRHEVIPKGIKVTCIEPGDVKTNLLSVTKDEDARKQYDGSNSVRILDPDDIGRAVTFVVSQPRHVGINQLLIEPREAPI